MIKIITPQKIESGNKFNNQRGDPRKYSRYKNLWRNVINLDLAGCSFKRVAERRTIIIISVRSRLLDRVNLAQGAKPILDILQDLNVIYNDSPHWLDDWYFQEIFSENQRTEILIF